MKFPIFELYRKLLMIDSVLNLFPGSLTTYRIILKVLLVNRAGFAMQTVGFIMRNSEKRGKGNCKNR